ncbi:MAG: DUF5624 domain-containing protein [Legionellaceae bacterium]|nr:DUF5624 domain-containing protein [Legionellaceae bacterium]
MVEYTTPNAFYDLYYDFTGYTHNDYPKNQTAIAQDLSMVVAQSSKQKPGPLIIANSVGIYVYSGEKGHRLMSSASYRAQPDSGFYEITSVSHVGPAIAYLGALKDLGSALWEKHLDPLIHHLRAVREVNSAPQSEHWLTQLNAPIFRGKETQIKNMIDYACSLAANYLLKVKKEKTAFGSQHIVENFLNIQTASYPIPYDNVMIGTFALAGLQSMFELYHALHNVEIDWEHAKIILHNLAGTNYGAGITAGSNWLVPVIQSIAGTALDPKRILIVPYAPLPNNIGAVSLSDEDFDAVSNKIWGAIYTRPFISEAAFSHVEDLVIPYRAPLPGDYEATSADDIHDFIKRLKFSVTSPKQMLSNTVGFWLAGEAVKKKWQFEHMDLPGLTHGFPSGMTEYPDHAPSITE